VINLDGVISANWRDLSIEEISPGIRKRILWQGTNGAKAQILEIDPGSQFLTFDTHSPVGSTHVPQFKQGCVIFVFFPKG
jgi:hypothetical protein